MANEQNLRPGKYKLTLEEQKKGGKASGEVRAARRDLRKAFEALLDQKFTDNKSGKKITGAEAIAMKQMEKALKGDPKAFELVRDTAGQKPVEKVVVAEVDQAVIDEVESLVFGGNDNE